MSELMVKASRIGTVEMIGKINHRTPFIEAGPIRIILVRRGFPDKTVSRGSDGPDKRCPDRKREGLSQSG